MSNAERRKRVMQRSIKLGHCVCDPKKPCPCDLFKEKDICLCAGERLESPTEDIALTSLVEKPGCASKIDQAFLKEVLQGLPSCDDPRVLVGVAAGDDAGIFDMQNGTSLVQTVDVFTPSVDDPYTFGQIAAANSVSDVYAMGGEPLTALSVLGFPVRKIPDRAMSEILRGGIDKMKEAGVSIIGGHSINDPEIKAGFAVTGIIDTDKVKTNANAKVNDVLILTKPIGTGIIAFANQINRAQKASIEASARSMATLNKTAARLMVKHNANACTDITGFSLLGHLTEMASSSKVNVEIIWDDIPVFPGVMQCLADGILPGAIERNKESCGHLVKVDNTVDPVMVDMCYDAQTSGGLLISISPEKAKAFIDELDIAGITGSTIGSITNNSSGIGVVTIKTTGSRKLPTESTSIKAAETRCCGNTVPSSGCCDNDPPSASCCDSQPIETGCSDTQPSTSCEAADSSSCCETGSSGESCCGPIGGKSTMAIQTAYSNFLRSANTPNNLDSKTRAAINIAISVATKCSDCLEMHMNKARELGMSLDEINEAAWLAIAFSGSPAMIFYNKIRMKMH